MTINIKIAGKDPFTKTVLVSVNTDKSLRPIDEYPAMSYPHDYGGAANLSEFLENIKEPCREIALRQDYAEQQKFEVDSWVGQQFSFALPVPDGSEAEYLEKKRLAWAQYPAANPDTIRYLLAQDFANMQLAPLIRPSDMTLIGVYVNGYAGKTAIEGAIALKSIKKCTELCIELGVPMCGGTTPGGGNMTREDFVRYLQSISPYNRFIAIPRESYVYQEWCFDLAKNRKRTFINSERNQAVSGGIVWNGYTWDSDSIARENVLNAVTAINSGATLPAGFTWRTKDNQDVPADAALLVGLSHALSSHISACYQKSWERKAKLDALPDTATFDEIDAI